MQKLMVSLSIVALITLVPLSETFAAPYYEGKTIRLIVGNSPGGGYDRLARLFAKYLPKYIPGRPGEECLKISNYILNQPEKIVREVGKYIKL